MPPAALRPKNDPQNQLHKSLSVLHGRWTIWRWENSWRCWDSNPDPSILQSVSIRCTDCTTAALKWARLRGRLYDVHFMSIEASFRVGAVKWSERKVMVKCKCNRPRRFVFNYGSWRKLSSGMLRRVAPVRTDGSKEFSAFFVACVGC
jgi:hypothetical protein